MVPLMNRPPGGQLEHEHVEAGQHEQADLCAKWCEYHRGV